MRHFILLLSLIAAPLFSIPVPEAGAQPPPGQIGRPPPGQIGSPSGVPELDPTAAGSAIVLLLGGVAYLASRRREGERA